MLVSLAPKSVICQSKQLSIKRKLDFKLSFKVPSKEPQDMATLLSTCNENIFTRNFAYRRDSVRILIFLGLRGGTFFQLPYYPANSPGLFDFFFQNLGLFPWSAYSRGRLISNFFFKISTYYPDWHPILGVSLPKREYILRSRHIKI